MFGRGLRLFSECLALRRRERRASSDGRGGGPMSRTDDPQPLSTGASALADHAVEALRRYQAVRQGSLALTRSLTPEDQLAQSMPDASPTKWHLAHTTWFWETFLLV